MTPLGLVGLALFAGSAAASMTAILRAVLVDFGWARLVLEVKPFNCDLCCSFWGSAGIALACSGTYGPWAAAALAGVAPSMALLRALRPAPVAPHPPLLPPSTPEGT